MELDHNSVFYAFSQTKKKMHKTIEERGIYLPFISSSCCKDDFYEGIETDKIFTLKSDTVKTYPNKINGVTKSTLFCELKSINQNTKKLNFGFNETCLPNKEYMTKLLYYLQPQHEYFLENNFLK